MAHHIFAEYGAGLIVPPKLYNNQDNFTKVEVELTEKVANLRIHVERGMARAKEWGILHRTLPITYKDLATDIFTCCALMGNFKLPLIGNDFYDE